MSPDAESSLSAALIALGQAIAVEATEQVQIQTENRVIFYILELVDLFLLSI